MAAQARFVRCPSCQWGTLADGNYCAYCGQPLRQAAPQQAPPQPQTYRQAPPAQAQPGYGSTQQYYQQPGQQAQYYQPGTGPQGSFAAPGSRGPVQCPNCGAPNDPWMTHCKQCTRPLMSTG